MKKSNRVSRAEAERFVILYQQLGTYQAVADATGRSSSTVGKWVKILLAEKTIVLK